jgi:molecular chaperone DnaK
MDYSKIASSDVRNNYDSLIVKVDSKSKPFHERLNLTLNIDEYLILNPKHTSKLSGDSDSCEIYDLEFGISIPNASTTKKVRLQSNFW